MALDPFAFARAQAALNGVDPDLVTRVMSAESGGNVGAISPKGARGPMQLMPATAAGLGVNPDDPEDNIRGGVRLLAQHMKTYGDPALALAAYNAGPGNVQKYGGVPPFAETQNYIRKILGDQAAPQRGVQVAQNGNSDDIFGFAASGSSAAKSGTSDDIFGFGQASNHKPLQIQLPPEPYKISATDAENEPAPQGAPDGVMGAILNSPIGGVIHGFREKDRGVMQAITRAGEAILPSSLTTKARRFQDDRLNSENKDYLDNWRKGQMGDDFDVGRAVGNVAGSLPLLLVPGLNGAGIVSGAGLGLASGALSPVYGPKDNPDFWSEKAGATALGGALGGAGGAVAKGIGSFLKPVQNALPEAATPALDAAERLGVTLTTGQKTGSRALQQVEDTLARTPGASGAANELRMANQTALNRAAASSIGETADSLGEAVMAKAKERLGNEFSRLSSATSVALGDDFIGALAKIDAANKGLGSFASPEVGQLVDKGLELASKGQLDGKAYQTLRSRLGDRAGDAFRSGNSEVGQAIKTLRDSLDDAARAGLSDADKTAWDVVRSQYGNLKTLEKGRVINAGDVNPNAVGGALRQFNPSAYRSGAIDSPLMDIARYGEAFKPPIPGSQTYERGLVHQMMFGNPLTGVPAALSAASAQGLLGSSLGKAYLEKGLLPLSPEVQGLLTRSGAIGGALQGPNLLGAPQRR